MSLPIHPLADLFPLIEGVEFLELVASVKANGLFDPITLLAGAILDGRNRYRACQEAGVEPRFEDFDGDDPYAFVAAKNISRRHLTPSQRGMIAAEMTTLKWGQRADYISKPAEGEMPPSAITLVKAAGLMGVNRDTVKDARKVLNEGTAEEIAAVRSGQAAVTTIAKELRKKVPAEQRARTKGEAGKNPERFENHRIEARLWADMRAVFDGISNLPRPSDCVKIGRRFDRNGLLDTRLLPTINWLKEFSHEWSNRNGSADQEIEASGHHSDTGTGDRAA